MVEEDKTFEEAYERLKKASSDWNDSINSPRREGELQGEARGIEKGLQQGRIAELIELVRNGLLDAQKVADRVGMTLEEFQAVMQKE